MVEYDIANVKARFRLPLPAQEENTANWRYFLFHKKLYFINIFVYTIHMEIKTEFESALILCNMREFVMDKRKFDECIPENLKEGREYGFLKSGQLNYWILGKFPLHEKLDPPVGGVTVSKDPRAIINIFEVTHFIDNGQIFTKGKYKILQVIG